MTSSVTQPIKLNPSSAVTVVKGEVAVFSVVESGRRVPLAPATNGFVIHAGSAIDGISTIAVPIPGTELETTDAATLVSSDGPTAGFIRWIDAIARAATDGHWPLHRAPLGENNVALAPGECVLNDEADIAWLRLISGTARLCGSPNARVSSGDDLIALPRGTWLEADLRARIEFLNPAGLGERQLLQGAQKFIHLGILATLDTWHQHQSARRERVAAEVDREQAAISATVKSLTSAVEPSSGIDEVDPAIIPALSLIRAYGIQPDAATLATISESVASGSDPVQAVADACDVTIRRVKLSDTWMDDEGLPLLAELADETGKRRWAVVQWNRGWHAKDAITGAPIELSPTDLVGATITEFQPLLPARPQNLGDLVQLALKGSLTDAIFVLGAAVVTAITAFVSPRLLGQLADMLSTKTQTSAFTALFLMLAALAVTVGLWQVVQSLALLRMRARMTTRAAIAVWDRLIRQSNRWHSRFGLGDRLSQGSAVNMATTTITDQSVVAVLNLIAVMGSLGALASVGVRTFAMITVLLVVQALIAYLLLRRTSEHLRVSLEAGAKASSRLIEVLNAIPRLRVAAAESRALAWWSQTQAEYLSGARSMRITMMLDGVVRAVWPTLIVIALVAGIWMSGDSIGTFITVQAAAIAATTTLSTAITALGAIALAQQTMARAEPVLTGVPEALGMGVDPGTINGAFTLTDLHFSYPDGPTVIDGISLTIQPGEHLAIVGTSGCGKTTLIRLLLGLDDPDSGMITCDGNDMATLNRVAVRRQIGSVLQSSKLLPGSLHDNVSMGRNLSTAQIWAALDAAQIGDDVRAMPMGLQTPLTDGGTTMSGGQQQRILIARALAGEPRVLVFDEATSALDNKSQLEITKLLDSLRITLIVVAHRLSTIRHASQIIVMNEGQIVDSGSFDELVERHGLFKELMARQQLGEQPVLG